MSEDLRRKVSRRKTGESAYFNLHTLRRLYNPENLGRGSVGRSNRYDMHPTFTHLTYLMLTRAVPTGKGQYGSPVIELALRTLLAITAKSVSIEKVAEELSVAVLDRASLVANLQELTMEVKKYAIRHSQDEA